MGGGGGPWPFDCISAVACFIDLTAGRRGHAPKNSELYSTTSSKYSFSKISDVSEV